MSVKREFSSQQQKQYDILYSALGELLKGENPDKRETARAIEAIEYELQAFWGFPIDSSKHRYWCVVRGCTCPKMDNMESHGIHRVISGGCPYHGNP